jgi:hypothetical protein
LSGVRLCLLAVLTCPVLWGAEVCPPGKSFWAGGAPAAVLWNSYQSAPRPGKFCVGNQVRNQSPNPVEVAWQAAGIERAALKGDLSIAECCFDVVASAKATLRAGSQLMEVTMNRAAEEGLAGHEEGYPDLIEEDARIRTVSIRGTLSDSGRDVPIRLVLKCTASQFAKQFAYQYSITDRSAVPVEVKWDLLESMRRRFTPSVQAASGGKTYLFLADAAPREAAGRIELRTSAGRTVAVFRFEGFQANPGK